ncbi:MAG TPA: hypothetical protein VFS37_07925 [Conexibacter sp.]|nr:hypothetical protein [Conexibacter sp.]
MELEERTIEELPDRCEECGAPLTEQEQQQAMETGGAALCSVHAAELLAADELDVDDVDELA